MKVLVAEGSKAVRRMIVAMVSELRPYVDEVLEAEDGASARRAAAAVGRELAVVITNWDLPGLPGTAVAGEMREICGGRDVAVLACINPGQQPQVAAAGPLVVRDHVVRPFSPEELRKKLLAILAQCPEAMAEASAMLKSIASSTTGDADLPFFLQLPSGVMKDFLELASAAGHPAGTILVAAGRKVDALHVVSSGTVEVVGADGTAGETVGEGNCFGELSFMGGDTSPVSVRARTRVEVVSLDRSRLAELLRRQPRMSQYLGLLASRRAKASSLAVPGGSSGMGGNLRSMPFSDLLQMLHTTGKSGELQLECKDARGAIALVEGNVVHAQVGDASGEEAFYRLSAWTQGMFYFKAGAQPKATTIAQPTMSLLMEAMRRLDEGKLPPAAPPSAGADSSLEELFGGRGAKSSAPPPELFGDEPSTRRSTPPPDF